METKTKIMREEMEKRGAKEDLDKQQRDMLKGIVDKKKRLGSAVQKPLLVTTNNRLAGDDDSKQ